MLELAGRYDLQPSHLFDHFSHYLTVVGDFSPSSGGKGTPPKTLIPFDRSRPESAAQVLAMLYPEPEVRHACMEYLAQTVQFASTLHNNNWGLTLHPREIRLNVGPVEVLALRKNEVLLLLDAESLAPRDRKKISPPVEFSSHRYRRVPGEKGIGEMGVDKFIRLREQFREAHQRFIRKASAKFTATAWAAAHSPGVLQHLREAIAVEIPNPEYAQILPISPTEPDVVQTIISDGLEAYHAQKKPEGNPYPLEDLAAETGHPIEVLRGWIAAIERKGQAIIYGPPGTGKTYLAERLARHLSAGGEGMQELVQFHPSYSYEDFVIGIRPVSRGDVVEYPMQPGRFVEFCRKAQARRGTCVLVVDEINRADISRVFGELMYLLEYRDRTIELAGGELFRIPNNVRVIGTMNTADRSIALLDYALRRRFAFVELRPDYELLRRYHANHRRDVERLIALLTRMNQRINNPHYELGISFFLHPNLPELLGSIWAMEIEPYLAEYFYDQPATVEEFRWERVRGDVG
ncbi:MAG: AAA family ATPase [Armatimonadetes bacterium]|nr:AAA family ATPase [Armatimonadota bacterium]